MKDPACCGTAARAAPAYGFCGPGLPETFVLGSASTAGHVAAIAFAFAGVGSLCLRHASTTRVHKQVTALSF